ncbi:MAG: PTS sugar transporter subunit IIA [Erysipelotrichaceae bacterium]|nr:PTS sugar transporter subunit IIA [Erysipelotrichaceae bacterium]
MIGIILTGHGRFGEGLYSSMELIAGPQDHFRVVNFEHEPDELEKDLREAIDALSDCEGIIVFTDLAGGSPFKISAILAEEKGNIRVIVGTNLPMLMEVALTRNMEEDLEALTELAVNTGKDQVYCFSLTDNDDQTEEFEDGI